MMMITTRSAWRRWRGGTRFVAAAAVLLLSLVCAPGAHAQEGPGAEIGVSAQPDQFYFGANDLTAPIASEIRFRPNLEVGVGSGSTLVGVNFDFVDRIALRHTPWKLYLGGGPALNITRRSGATESGGGFNLVLGVQHPEGLFTEIKVGVLDSPSFKFGVGYTFGR